MSVASAILQAPSLQTGLTGNAHHPSPTNLYFSSLLHPLLDVPEEVANDVGQQHFQDLYHTDSNTEFLTQIIAQFIDRNQSPSATSPAQKIADYSEINFKPSAFNRPSGASFAPLESADMGNGSQGFLSGISSYIAALTRNSSLPVVTSRIETVSFPLFA